MKCRPSHLRKLTDEQVLDILRLIHEEDIVNFEIAKMFNTTHNTICDIRKIHVYKDAIAVYAAACQSRFEHR